MYCAFCRAELRPGERYCGECGQPVQPAPSPTTPQPAVARPVPPPPDAEPTRPTSAIPQAAPSDRQEPRPRRRLPLLVVGSIAAAFVMGGAVSAWFLRSSTGAPSAGAAFTPPAAARRPAPADEPAGASTETTTDSPPLPNQRSTPTVGSAPAAPDRESGVSEAHISGSTLRTLPEGLNAPDLDAFRKQVNRTSTSSTSSPTYTPLTSTWVKASQDIPLLKEPKEGSRAAGTIPRGTTFEVTGEFGDYFEARRVGKLGNGYVRQDDVERVER